MGKTVIHHPHLTTMTETIAFHSERHPDHTAVLTSSGQRSTYRDLHQASDAVAAGLAALGVTAGDRVAYLGREGPAYWEVLFAAARTGAVLVPVNWKLTATEVGHILADCDARVVFLDGDHPLRGTTSRHEVVTDGDYPRWRDTPRPPAPRHEATPQTPLAQLYTSGTTGLPKGVVLPHHSFFAIRDALAAAELDWIDWRDGDVALIGIPGFHIGGLWYATQAFHAGATVYSMPTFDPATVRRAVSQDGVTVAIFVPAMMRSILASGADAAEFAGLRKVVYGGAPISEALLEESARVFDCDFAQIYGLTETGNTAICLPPEQHVPGSVRLRAAGRPYPGVQVRIVEDGVEVPQGGTGEVHLRTPAAMLEYWNLPEATAATLVDGWVRTGDAGYLDDEGYLYIQDRVKDMILVGGENVFPAEIENALAAHPAVADVAVVGVPDDHTGEAVLAHVVFRPDQQASTRQLMLFLRGRIADFKLPSRYQVLDAVPRNPSGKILRRELREPHWRGHQRRVN
ncbi:long-chain-fatty-acid--CoA ligase [Micromonospora yangpuensis]|uniref:Long-chain acyl-CoA synthetase n=1 Tax=Micromonospora yangpuensis TaxID=683228 RepID=A0A1C6UWP5_9ACTN|nr:long-chain-fatty-acid--CoA ligase [Micromonospora yangpuensis]SCL58475.1 long-chain acyl-CoA synthetase [Micromonospora yangpuensis]